MQGFLKNSIQLKGHMTIKIGCVVLKVKEMCINGVFECSLNKEIQDDPFFDTTTSKRFE